MTRPKGRKGLILSGGLSPTIATVLASYNCTAACENCCFDSHPGIRKRLSRAQILAFIDDAKKFKSLRLLVFSGGECFLLGKDLTAGVRHATDLGLHTRCVTNGYWAKNEETALARLSELKEAGLCELNISTGDFHQRFVAHDTVVNGVLAALKLDLPIVVMVELQLTRRVTAATIRNDPRIQAAIGSHKPGLFKIIESPWMPMSADEILPQHRNRLINRDNVHRRKGCESILTTLVATPSGRIGSCCGLSREHIPELHLDAGEMGAAYEKAATDFMNIWLSVEGPEKILAWAAGKDPAIEWENRYAHHCHACLKVFSDDRVRSVIKAHYREKVDEVLLKYNLLTRSRRVSAPKPGNRESVKNRGHSTGAPDKVSVG